MNNLKHHLKIKWLSVRPIGIPNSAVFGISVIWCLKHKDACLGLLFFRWWIFIGPHYWSHEDLS